MKDASRSSKRIVGGFLAFSILAVCVVIFLVGGNFGFLRGSTEYRAVFANTDGLNVGAPIKIGGVTIGSVDSIEIENHDGLPLVIAKLVVVHPHDRLIKVDSKIQTDTQGVLGDKFIDVGLGKPDAPVAPPGSTLQTAEHTELSAVVAKSGDIVESINVLAKRLESFAQSLPDQKTMKNMTSDISEATVSLSALAKSLNSKDSALRLLSDKDTAIALRSTLDNLKSGSQHLASAAAKVDSGQGTIGALVNDASLYDDMKSLMGRANRSKALKFIIQKSLATPSQSKVEPATDHD